MVLSQLGVRVPLRIALAGQDQTGSREPNPRTTEEPRFSYWPGQNEHVRRPRRDVDRGSAVLPAVEPLLKARKGVEKQTADLDSRAIRLARNDAEMRRFMTAPGIGVITARCYRASVGSSMILTGREASELMSAGRAAAMHPVKTTGQDTFRNAGIQCCEAVSTRRAFC